MSSKLGAKKIIENYVLEYPFLVKFERLKVRRIHEEIICLEFASQFTTQEQCLSDAILYFIR